MAQHNELGRYGEKLAARHLMMQGYELLAQDWQWRHKDIDLVMRKDGVIVFVEVKTRSTTNYGQPEDTVDRQKVNNILSAASAYMRRNKIDAPFRFDIVGVVGVGEPYEITHFKGAINSHSQTWGLPQGGAYRKY